MSHGPQDTQRLSGLNKEERENLEFEVGFFEEILKAYPSHLDAMRALAEDYTQLGFYHDGLKIDRLICILATEDATAFYNLACSQALTSDVDSALESLAKAWDLGYRDREHILRDTDLASLREDPRFAKIIGLKKQGGSMSKGQSNA